MQFEHVPHIRSMQMPWPLWCQRLTILYKMVDERVIQKTLRDIVADLSPIGSIELHSSTV